MCRGDGEMCIADGEKCRADSIEKSSGGYIENSRRDGENGIALPDKLQERCENLKKWESSKNEKHRFRTMRIHATKSQ